VWDVRLSFLDTSNPVVEAFQRGFDESGVPSYDQVTFIRAWKSFSEEQIESAKRDKSAYNASACLDVMVGQSLATAKEILDGFMK
jgi:hypothetical protein